MNKQEQELFDFYTDEVNFKTALEVFEYLPSVRRELLLQFWENVKDKIDSLINEKGLAYKVELPSDIFERYSACDLYKDEWGLEQDDDDFPICFKWNAITNDLHLGLWLNHDSKKWDKKKIKSAFNELKIRKQFKFDNEWWCMGRFYEFSFKEGKYDSLKLLLPANRDKTVNEFASSIIEFAINVEKEIDIMKLLRQSLIK